jgi:hypothetical protein
MANTATALLGSRPEVFLDTVFVDPVDDFSDSPFSVDFSPKPQPRTLEEKVGRSLTGRAILPVPASSLLQFHVQAQWEPLRVPALPVLPAGISRGGILELIGRRSSGRTAASLHILAQATQRGEVCAVVDTNDNFHPASAASAGVCLDRIVWVRCGGNAEHAMRSVDLLLHAGGFGVVMLDVSEVSMRILNRIPLSYWFRFQRAVENTPAILVVSTRAAQARSCAVNAINLELKSPRWSGSLSSPLFRLLRGLAVSAQPQRPASRVAQELAVRSNDWPGEEPLPLRETAPDAGSVPAFSRNVA